jgi:hypothetical protein
MIVLAFMGRLLASPRVTAKAWLSSRAVRQVYQVCDIRIRGGAAAGQPGRLGRSPRRRVQPLTIDVGDGLGYTGTMLARVFSCAVIGLEGVIVEVEVDTAQGLPGTDIVGLPDKAVQESRARAQAAFPGATPHDQPGARVADLCGESNARGRHEPLPVQITIRTRWRRERT